MFNSLLSDVLFLFVFCIHYIAKWMLALYQALVFFLSASTSSAVLRIFPVNTSCPSLLTFAAMLNFYFQTCLCSLENLFLFRLHIFQSFFCQYDLLYTFYFICGCQVHLYFKKICKIESFRAFYLNCSKCLLLMRTFEITKCT